MKQLYQEVGIKKQLHHTCERSRIYESRSFVSGQGMERKRLLF